MFLAAPRNSAKKNSVNPHPPLFTHPALPHSTTRSFFSRGNLAKQLADFGLARSVAEGPLGGHPCGTPTYMAPERLKMLPHGTQARVTGVYNIY